ncbi:MAG: family 16 glycosylhydrolase [Bacteroidetes bacterium]|nr:family 16 glycosylhydrolase [Bacteroidota bacterium]
MIKRILLTFFMLALASGLLFAQKKYKGAEYRTKSSFLYGRFEASIKVAGKEGALASFFTYNDSAKGTSEWNEIDIEILGRYKNDVQFNTITPGQSNHVRHQYVNFNPAVDFHTYAFEWTPDYVAWFIDGVEVYRQTGAHIKTLVRSQKLMMNVWNPIYTNWAGVWNDSRLPAFSFYDWAAYYKYTPGIGNYGTGNNFTFDWRDDFNSWDTSRWDKATHTWDGNGCDFVVDNAAFNNGKLVLCLTDKSNLGYVDKISPSLLNVVAIDNTKIQASFSEDIDKTGAEIKSNYLINSVAINSATLLNDNRTVELSVSGFDPSSAHNLIITSGIKDAASPSNTMGMVSKTIVVPPSLTFPLKINAGNNHSPIAYISDKEWTPESNYGFMDGDTTTYTGSIANTAEGQVYLSERHGLAKYFFRVPNGVYRVKLMFAENYFTSVGSRIFDVYIQGQKSISDLDILKEAGRKTALVKTIDNINVTDGLIEIHFAAQVGEPLINGIVVDQISTDVKEGKLLPTNFKLEQNYPNPFNPATVIGYRLASSGNVSLKVYDSLGREVATIVDEEKSQGNYEVTFNVETRRGESLPSGVYIYRLQAGSYSNTKKMILLK